MKNKKLKSLVVCTCSAGGGGKIASAGARGVDLRSAGQAARTSGVRSASARRHVFRKLSKRGEHYVTAVATGTKVLCRAKQSSELFGERGAHKSANCEAIELRFDRQKATESAAFTMAGAGQGALLFGWLAKGIAFTMAEILLSLTIIGVVAAITLPSLTGNINERTWNTQRKALFSRMSQAVALMPALNGYGIGATQEETNSKAGEVFVTEGLSKVLKLNNICDYQHLADCGIASSYTNLNGIKKAFPTNLGEMDSAFTTEFNYSTSSGTSYTFVNPQAHINTNAAAFETNNGESIAVFYNPICMADLNNTKEDYIFPYMCANFIYDLNGSKGPNTIGKDMGFITAMYPSDTNLVAPMPLIRQVGGTYTYTQAIGQCKLQDSESRLPNRDEMTALYYNKEFIGIDFTEGNSHYWTSSKVSADKAWYLGNYTYRRNTIEIDRSFRVWCIKR